MMMSSRLIAVWTVVLTALVVAFPGLASAQAAPVPTLSINYSSPTNLSPQEGELLIIQWQVSEAVEESATFIVETRHARTGPHATPTMDYRPLTREEVLIGPYYNGGTIDITLKDDDFPELDEKLEVRLSEFRGVGAGPGVTEIIIPITIRDDDMGPAPALSANNDQVFFRPNSSVQLDPAENDFFDRQDSWNGFLSVTALPEHGTLAISDNSQSMVPDRWSYIPDPDFAGEDRIGYRVCVTTGECQEATIRLQGALADSQFGKGYSGYRQVELVGVPAAENVRFTGSSLGRIEYLEFATSVDATPEHKWDGRSGWDWKIFTIPATVDGSVREYRVFAEFTDAEQADLLVGIDRDGNGEPSPDEELCFFRRGAGQECEIAFEASHSPVTYWVAVHSHSPAAAAPLVTHALTAMDGDQSTLVAAGPTQTTDGERTFVRFMWKNYLASRSDSHIAYIRMWAGDEPVGQLRMRLGGGGGLRVNLPANEPTTFKVSGDSTLSAYSDVPGGASRHMVTVESDREIQVILFRGGWIEGRDPTTLAQGGDWGDAEWETLVPGQPRTLVAENPTPGRWVLLAQNGAEDTHLTISTSVEAVAPTIRTGSYFNEFQPGSGLIIYPAGDQWAGLWYTHNSLGKIPTWYYLQAPQPGADGIWVSPVYRMSWYGGSARSTRVGYLQVTSVLPDVLLMSYMLNGSYGVQAIAPLGRGCPSLHGQVVDASSHWFDPARAGTGYSVQMWPNYEFYAAFMYDYQGEPIFFAAEGPFVEDEVASFELETLWGNCPSCMYDHDPTRRPAGVLTRVLRGGSLAQIELNVDYEGNAWSPRRRTWSVLDQVQTLGGEGTTQGCAP